MKSLFVLILVSLNSIICFSQETIPWLPDQELIKGITEIYDDIDALEDYLLNKIKPVNKSNLGFGYFYLSERLRGETIGITCNLYYFKDSLISYVIIPQLPRDESKHTQYLKWYDNTFDINELGEILPYYYNFSELSKPLSFYPGSIKNSETLDFYMTPESGLEYGCRGGYFGSLLSNRALFFALSDQLTKNTILQMMCSINPATRLTAIEYYYKNPHQFSTEKSIIHWWINRVYKEVPIIASMSGCSPYSDSTNHLVQYYLKNECTLLGYSEVKTD